MVYNVGVIEKTNKVLNIAKGIGHNISFDSIEPEIINGLGVIQVKNVAIITSELNRAHAAKNNVQLEEIRHFPGTSFIVMLDGIPWAHVVYEVLSQFSALRVAIPDIKMIVLNTRTHIKLTEAPSLKDYYCYEFISNAFGVNEEENFAAMYRHHMVTFDTAIYYDKSMMNVWADRIFPQTHPKAFSDPHSYEYKNTIYHDSIRKFLIPLLNKDVKPEKLYVSRLKANNNKRSLIEEWISERPDFPPNGKVGAFLKIKEYYCLRNIDLEAELEIEKTFREAGWRIYDPGNESFIEQLSIIHAAKEIASLRGAGLASAVVCKEGTRIHIINVSDKYTYDYEGMINPRNDKKIISYPSQENRGRTFHSFVDGEWQQDHYSYEKIVTAVKEKKRLGII